MNTINPEKLLHSKWTSTSPKNKELHFMVVKLIRNEMEQVVACELEAILTKKTYTIDWKRLKNKHDWLFGWQ
jgi:tryptophan-rich hypothetical protein